jgi:ech hydrogenase subunit D
VIEEQLIEEIPLASLLARVQLMQAAGCRLVQIGCTRLAEDHEMNYSFEKPEAGAPAAGAGGAGPHGGTAEGAGTAARLPKAAGAAASGGPRFHTIRVRLPLEGAELPSISSFYWSAFLYENEIHDLFGVTVHGMAIDFHGAFYKLAVKTPYAAKEENGGQ